MSIKVFYNELDPYCCAWLSNLMDAGQIRPGTISDKSIVDLTPDEVRPYELAHFFAGIAGWDYALTLAGWRFDGRVTWTGSCPCQPFSSAGAGKAADDSRHLWPRWFPLIAECRPAIVFGEQVEAAIGWGWLDAVFADLESQGYACGASVLPACSVGAPHIRQRLWFVADADHQHGRRQHEQLQRSRARPREQSAGDRSEGLLAHPNAPRLGLERSGGLLDGERATQRDDAHGRGSCGMAPPNGRHPSPEGLQRGGEHGQREEDGRAGELGDAEHSLPSRRKPREFDAPGGERQATRPDTSGAICGWSNCEWLPCTDGKARPVEPGSFPLAHGVQRRASKLRAYGNAIVPQVAATFIATVIES